MMERILNNKNVPRFRVISNGLGEGGIRTLGSLLGYGALAKRCFRPLSHLTKICSHG
jgi:hypothetical protein